MANAMEAEGQNMDQETANELVRRQGHDLHPIPTLDAIVFPFESDRSGVGTDQAAVRDCNSMRITAEIG